MQGFVLCPWTTVRSSPSLTSFTQDEEEWIDLDNFGDCAFWVDVSELTNPFDSVGQSVPVKLFLETAPIPDETLFQPVAPPLTLAARSAPYIVKSIRTPTTAPLSRWVRWRLDATGSVSGTWSSTFRIRAVPGKSFFFNPADILGCQLWLRGDLGVTLNGNNVSAWADQSGNNNNASQSTAGAQPPWSATAMNGFPAIQGDGAARFMTTTSFTFGSDMTFITAVLPSVAPQTGAARIIESRYDTSYFLGADAVAGTLYKLIVNSATAPYGAADGGSIQTTNQIVSATYDSSITSGTLFLNGAQVAQDNTFAAPASQSLPLYLMRASGFAGCFFAGYLGEVMVFNRALSAQELLRIHRYLGNRYGIVI